MRSTFSSAWMVSGVLAAVLGAGLPSRADTVVAAADTEINLKMTRRPAGSLPDMHVRTTVAAGEVLRAFARFDLSSLPTAGDAKIDRAVLRLWVNQVVRPGTVHV